MKNEDSGLTPPKTLSPSQPDSFRLLITQWLTAALNFLYPPTCLDCKRTVGSLWCSTCQAKIVPVAPLLESHTSLVERRSTGEFADGLRLAIHALKYENKRDFASILGQRLVDEFNRSTWQPALITAVPLHPTRQRQRGYNQSDLLSTYLAQCVKIPFRPDAIQRIKDTPPQINLKRQERALNVADAFQADPLIVQGQDVMLIDDVCTTGATLRACADALKVVGAGNIWALTVASVGSVEMKS